MVIKVSYFWPKNGIVDFKNAVNMNDKKQNNLIFAFKLFKNIITMRAIFMLN